MTATRALQRPRKVDDRLLIGCGQCDELVDSGVGLRAAARVGKDRLNQAAVGWRRPAVVQEEDLLTDAPQRRRAELITSRGTLGHRVGQASPMRWIARSVYGWISRFDMPVKRDEPVVSELVWHSTQPMPGSVLMPNNVWQHWGPRR
jgi:hypothetical protein